MDFEKKWMNKHNKQKQEFPHDGSVGWGSSILTAVAQVATVLWGQSLAQGILHATGLAKKKPPPKKKPKTKKPQPPPPKRKRVIDSENKQVVARWEVSGGRREIGEGD